MSKPQPWYASLNQPPRSPKDGRNRRPSAPTHRRSPDRTNPTIDPGPPDTSLTYLAWASWAPKVPEPSKIPYAGVRAGEIIGYRLWHVHEGNLLGSIAHYFIWEPGQVIEGDVDKAVCFEPFHFIYGGVYCYFTPEQLEEVLREFVIIRFRRISNIYDPERDIIGVAAGSIKCWGEVIEHEKGYRAQYAKVNSINKVYGEVDPLALKERYKV